MSKGQNEIIFTVNQDGKVIRVQNKDYKDVEVFISLSHADSLSLSLTVNPSSEAKDSKTQLYMEQGITYDSKPYDDPVYPGSTKL